MNIKYLCPKCGVELKEETDVDLREKYPFVCPECNENFYKIEATAETEVGK